MKYTSAGASHSENSEIVVDCTKHHSPETDLVVETPVNEDGIRKLTNSATVSKNSITTTVNEVRQILAPRQQELEQEIKDLQGDIISLDRKRNMNLITSEDDKELSKKKHLNLWKKSHVKEKSNGKKVKKEIERKLRTTRK